MVHIIVPGDRDVAEYGMKPVDRRQFLGYLGKGAAATMLSGAMLVESGCANEAIGPTPIQSSTPAPAMIALYGTFTDTLNGGAVYPFKITDDEGRGADSPDGSYRFMARPGQKTLTITSDKLKQKRIKTGNFMRDTELNIDGLASGVDVEFYRQTCMGIGSDYNAGIVPINLNGKSVRYNGPISRVLIVRSPEISDSYYDAIMQSMPAISEWTDGLLSAPTPEFVNSSWSGLPNSRAIQIIFSDNGFASSAFSDNNGNITHSLLAARRENNIRLSDYGGWTGIVNVLKHELGHTIGFDHNQYSDSHMYGRRNAAFFNGPSVIDRAAGRLKYSRSGNHELTANEDRDFVF